jgi:phage-related protein
MVKYYDVRFLDEALDFINSTDLATRKKIYYCVQVAQYNRDSEFFKKLTGSQIWEFRVLIKRKHIRIFAFWDRRKEAYVVCTHAMVKKTDKTPQKEIDKAERIRVKYLNNEL